MNSKGLRKFTLSRFSACCVLFFLLYFEVDNRQTIFTEITFFYGDCMKQWALEMVIDLGLLLVCLMNKSSQHFDGN